MKDEEFMEGIEILQDNYNKTISDNQLKLFYKNLVDMDKDKYLKNIEQHIRTSPFMPNVAELRNESRTARTFANYEQRDLSNIDLDNLYANKQYI